MINTEDHTHYRIRPIKFTKNAHTQLWRGEHPHWQYGVHFDERTQHWFWGSPDGPSPCDSLDHGMELCNQHLESHRGIGVYLDVVHAEPKVKTIVHTLRATNAGTYLEYVRERRMRLHDADQGNSDNRRGFGNDYSERYEDSNQERSKERGTHQGGSRLKPR